MPRITRKVPSYRRHASGQAVVTLSGRDHWLGSAVTELYAEANIAKAAEVIGKVGQLQMRHSRHLGTWCSEKIRRTGSGELVRTTNGSCL